MISNTGIYATKAVVILAEWEPGVFFGAPQIAGKIGAPRNYLGKLLKQMAEAGLLESQKGFGGGFRLAKPAAKIRLFDIIEPIEHVNRLKGCFLGRARCSDKRPCAVHKKWAKIRDQYLRFLKETKISDIT